jgi:hypothetical protein
MKIQRMFSNVEEEKLYSTGNEELDDLLERAFCEGYEYAQREFATREFVMYDDGKGNYKKLEITKEVEGKPNWFRANTEGDNERILDSAKKELEKRKSRGYISNHSSKDVLNSEIERAVRKGSIKNMAGKAAMIALPTAAAIGTGVAIKKHKDKKKKEQE